MVRVRDGDLRRRARRAYEAGRIRHAALRASPAMLFTAGSVALCHEPGASLAIGAILLALLTGLFWRGGVASQAASAGLGLGAVAFAVPVGIFEAHLIPFCCTLSSVLVVNGLCGLCLGGLLAIRSEHYGAQRNAFLVLVSLVAALCGMLGCILFGPIGLVGMGVGAIAPIGPVVVYRRATA